LSNGAAHPPRSPQVNVGSGKVPLFDGGYRMKKVFLALVAAAALAPTAVWAQGFSVGPGGVRIDSGDRYERRWDGDRGRRAWREDRRRGCRTIIIKKRNEWGRMETKRIERC
jgi:hypothetical protein